MSGFLSFLFPRHNKVNFDFFECLLTPFNQFHLIGILLKYVCLNWRFRYIVWLNLDIRF